MPHSRTRTPWIAGLFCGLLSACANQPAPVPAELPYGESKAAAIDVCRPRGQAAYLSRLVCPSGDPVSFSRIGNVGARESLPAGMSESRMQLLAMKMRLFMPLDKDEPHVHIVDAYAVACGDARTTLYLDMYHCDAPPPGRAPRGFMLRD